MSETAILDAMAAKVSVRIETLRQQLVIQELLLAELVEQRKTLAGADQATDAVSRRNGTPLPGQPTDQLAVAIEQILRDADGPKRLTDIASELERRGVPRSGKQSFQNAAFGAMRRRSNVFEKVGRGMYRLKT